MPDLSTKQRCIGNWYVELLAGLLAAGVDPHLIDPRQRETLFLLAHDAYGRAMEVRPIDVVPVQPAESYKTAA